MIKFGENFLIEASMSQVDKLKEESKSRHIRVFISSTFRDMQKERELLVKHTFPKIKAYTRERG